MPIFKVKTSPSLALIKYWGKEDSQLNTPATTSIAISLDGLTTETTVSYSDSDLVIVNGKEESKERFEPFFNHLRKKLAISHYFKAFSTSNFPVSAGLASSSSGFAALAYGCAKLSQPQADLKLISELARVGSASAARAVFGGFTLLRKGELNAEPLALDWPELRVLICIVKAEAKEVSSREAMERSRLTSPYYPAWLKESEETSAQALDHLYKKDLASLGPLIRKSFLGMFATMTTSSPPVFYWQPETISLLKTCQKLREKGFNVWETMDAGPQVKLVCLVHEMENILSALKDSHPQIQILISKQGPGAQ